MAPACHLRWPPSLNWRRYFTRLRHMPINQGCVPRVLTEIQWLIFCLLQEEIRYTKSLVPLGLAFGLGYGTE